MDGRLMKTKWISSLACTLYSPALGVIGCFVLNYKTQLAGICVVQMWRVHVFGNSFGKFGCGLAREHPGPCADEYDTPDEGDNTVSSLDHCWNSPSRHSPNPAPHCYRKYPMSTICLLISFPLWDWVFYE